MQSNLKTRYLRQEFRRNWYRGAHRYFKNQHKKRYRTTRQTKNTRAAKLSKPSRVEKPKTNENAI